MKRILAAGAFLLCVTVFFTGCTSSLIIPEGIDPVSIQNSVANETLNVNQSGKEPDYYALNNRVKFSDKDGIEAFKIKDGHSKKTDDLEDFQVADLLNDKIFVYGYVTKAEGNPEEIVHCGAFYNYKEKKFKVFHEKRFKRTDKEESFHLQICTSMNGDKGNIFVYDNGWAYLYDQDGKLKETIDIETFIQNQYSNVFSFSVVRALTDGDRRVYIEVNIEKEEIIVPEAKETISETKKDEDIIKEVEEQLKKEAEEENSETSSEAKSDDSKSDEELEKEAEEEEKKTESIVLVYESRFLNAELTQRNDAFDKQVDEWKSMVNGKEFERESLPDAEEDWKKAKETHPDDWGRADIVNLKASSKKDWDQKTVYEWNNDASFKKEGKFDLCSFILIFEKYHPFKELKKDRELDRQFFIINDRFSQLHGKIGNLSDTEEVEFSRKFTVYWEEEKPDADGNTTTEKHTETQEQKLKKTCRRKAPLENGYYETYSVLGQHIGLEDVIENEVIIKNASGSGKARWVKPDKKFKFTDIDWEIGENEQISILQDGKYIYLLIHDISSGRTLIMPDSVHEDHKDSAYSGLFNYKNLPGVPSAGTSEEDISFQEKNQDSLYGGSDGYGSGYLTKENILFSSLSLSYLDQPKFKELLVKQPNAVWEGLRNSSRGYLLTIPEVGILYYDFSLIKGKAFHLIEGTWYRSWKVGNRYVSVGFPNTDSSYERKDIAFAKVYEYSLNDVGNKRLEAMLNQFLQEEKEKKESSAAQSLEDMTSTEAREGVEDPLEQWNRDYEKKYK